MSNLGKHPSGYQYPKPKFNELEFFKSTQFSWIRENEKCILGVRDQLSSDFCTKYAVTGVLYADMVIRHGHGEIGDLKAMPNDIFDIYSHLKEVEVAGLVSDKKKRKHGDNSIWSIWISGIGFVDDLVFKPYRHARVINRLHKRPLAAAVFLTRNLKYWKGEGILKLTTKELNMRKLKHGAVYHAVLIVGHGKIGDEDYYLVQNSYGPDWGCNGYAKMSPEYVVQVFWPRGTFYGQKKEGGDCERSVYDDEVSPTRPNQKETNCMICITSQEGLRHSCNICTSWCHRKCIGVNFIYDEYICNDCTKFWNERKFLDEIGIGPQNFGAYVNGQWKGDGFGFFSTNPCNNEDIIAKVLLPSFEDYEEGVAACYEATKIWMKIPVQKRAEIVKQVGDAVNAKHYRLSQLVSMETGKALAEAIEDVQELINMCDFAMELSPQLLSRLVTSPKRPDHVILETWNPLGIVGVFNHQSFPCAFLGRHACIALLCGNGVVWGGHKYTSLTTIAITKIVDGVLRKNDVPPAIFTSFCGFCGEEEILHTMATDSRISVVSFPGKSQAGVIIKEKVNARDGKYFEELQKSQSIIVMDDADIELAMRSICPVAAGAGERFTTCSMLLLHENIYQKVLDQLVDAYKRVKVGNPLDNDTVVGPLCTEQLVHLFVRRIEKMKLQEDEIVCGGSVQGQYVKPTIVATSKASWTMKKMILAHILYVLKFQTLDEAIEINGSANLDFNSSIFTSKSENISNWVRPRLGNCGTRNVNMPANIGAYENDYWKQYVKRGKSTMQGDGSGLPLFLGI